MIHRTLSVCQEKTWQDELSEMIRNPEELFELLELDSSFLASSVKASKLFPLRVTRSYLSRIEKRKLDDPLLRQVLPVGEELLNPPGFSSDPLSESSFNHSKGLIHKYQGRVLLVAATQCAINCRYCFRREFDYTANSLSREQWQSSLDYIRANPDAEEVILSGGDPLSLSDSQLQWLVGSLSEIAHIKRLRVHTRLPIVLPSRLTSELLSVFTSSRFENVWVVHANHANEIDGQVHTALSKLATEGISVLNQSVLLKGVNDNVEALSMLSKRLFSCRVLPYYLHLLDRVNGSSHFEVPEERAKELHTQLLTTLSGYLVPKLVKEVAGAKSKLAV